ncbi:hypothetical protein V8F20_003382 [Naviculisporaceae sp. PSN 640]
MAEPAKPLDDSTSTKAPKDKKCPYCKQAFTSSSLGRHLDLFIKEKNPKPPDGVHDVEDIRKTRSAITRRRQRDVLSSSSRRGASSSKGRVAGEGPKNESGSEDPESPSVYKSPVSGREVGPGSSIDRGDPFTPVKNDYQDLENRERESKLALKVLIGSLKAAKQQARIRSNPFDIDPCTLDFPALVVRFLPASPTLFASIPGPASTSWSAELPGENQRDALKNYFIETLDKLKRHHGMSATGIAGEVTHPHHNTVPKPNPGEELRKLKDLEKKIFDHLQSTFNTWDELPAERREWFWKLELAKGVSRKQKQIDDLREENNRLRSQIRPQEHPQQHGDRGLVQPGIIHIEESVVDFLEENGSLDKMLGDPDSDLDTEVLKFIGRIAVSNPPNPGLGNPRPPSMRNDNRAPEIGGAVNATVNTGSATARGQAPVQTNVVQGHQQQQYQQQAQEHRLRGAGTNQEEDQDEEMAGESREDDSDADKDADGEEDDVEVDPEADADADADAEIEGVSAYNAMPTPEGVRRQQQPQQHPQSHQSMPTQHQIHLHQQPQQQPQQHPQQHPEQHSQQHAQQHAQQHPQPNLQPQQTMHTQRRRHVISSQQHGQYSTQFGPVRTQSNASQGRFAPYQTNDSFRVRSGGTVGATHMNHSMPALDQSLGSSNAGVLHVLGEDFTGGGGVHQYLNHQGQQSFGGTPIDPKL